MYRCLNCIKPNIMFRTGCCLIVLFIFITRLQAQVAAHTDSKMPAAPFYRHYTGTIGNHKAVIDLRYSYEGAMNYGGSTCYFTDEGGLNFFLISKPPSFSDTEVLRAQVFPENIPLKEVKNAYSIFVQTSRFEFTLPHDSLKGKWYVQNAQGPLIIALKEDYSAAVPLIFNHADDSEMATGRSNEPLKAVASYNGIQPSPKVKEKEAQFINKAVTQLLGGGGKSSSDAYNLAQAVFQQFFAGFHSALNKKEKPDGSNFSGIYTLFPVYNENGLLVLQVGGYQYDFANKEYTDRNRYLCLDVQNKKLLKLDDIIEPNNDLLISLLEKAFRNKYQLEPGRKISELFITEKMPRTDNFILVNKGLIFSYYPAKIFRDSEDISELQEMRLFLSYDELQNLLKPDFKARMGLK